jgi:hypothetical protein
LRRSRLACESSVLVRPSKRLKYPLVRQARGLRAGGGGPSTSLTSGIDGKTVALAVWETGGVADEYERRNVADERERRDEPVEDAPRGGDSEVHLHSELGEEAKRLATHPREEAHRLSEELKAGEVETTPLIALTGIGIALGLFIALVIALVFVLAYLI